MARRGFTLVELLVALSLFVVVGGIAMSVFLYQDRNWRTESDKAEVAMTAKGTLDELTRSIRSTGAGLPEGIGGIKVWGEGEEQAVFVTNENQWIDTLEGSRYQPHRGLLRISIHDAAKFSEDGNVAITLTTPPSGTPRIFILGILDRVASAGRCGDSLILDASPLVASPYLWTHTGDVDGMVNSFVYNLDSLAWRKSHDSLFVRRNRTPESVYALGIDSLRFRYWHPSEGWQDSLSSVAPADQIDKVWLRLVTRNSKADPKLRQQDPSSRGYRFSSLETEVALRNTKLTNH
jgi:prepilin-type N-terminal cleavage/methylation domain-containing protein